MAVLKKITLPNGTTYDFKDDNAMPYSGGAFTGPVTYGSAEEGRVKGNPYIVAKTFTNVIGTAADWANGTFFYGVIKPTDYYVTWRIHFRMEAIAAGRNDAKGISDVWLMGTQSSLTTYSVFNTIVNTSYRPAYYHELYRATSTGVTNYGHALGIRLYSSWNATTSANSRTIKIEIYETENCSFEFFNNMTKYASIPGTGSTNYSAYSEVDFANNGLQETGDSNTNPDMITYVGLKTGAQGVWQGSIAMEDGNGCLQNICTASDGTATGSNRTTNTTKKANTNGFRVGGTLYYVATNYNANTSIAGWGAIYDGYTSLVDSRYSINSTLTANFLTVYAPIYLVGTIHDDGLFYLDATWWTQTPTTTGKVYILIGGVYDSTTSNCRFTVFYTNPWYYYDGTKLLRFVGDANTVNGHTVAADVPSGAKFTDTVTTVSTTGTGNAITSISATNGAITATKGSTFLTSSDISGKIDTAGTGLSKSGTTLNHSNSVTAQTTQSVYPIKIDAQGHISSYGSAVTIPAAVTSDTVSGWGFTKNTGTITGITTTAPLSGSGTSGSVALSIAAASSNADGTLSSAFFTLLSSLNAHISFDSSGNIMFT